MGKRSFISERAADSPGAAQKSMEMDSNVGVEEEEVFRQTKRQNSTTNTSNSAIAKSKGNMKYHFNNYPTMKYLNKKCKSHG